MSDIINETQTFIQESQRRCESFLYLSKLVDAHNNLGVIVQDLRNNKNIDRGVLSAGLNSIAEYIDIPSEFTADTLLSTGVEAMTVRLDLLLQSMKSISKAIYSSLKKMAFSQRRMADGYILRIRKLTERRNLVRVSKRTIRVGDISRYLAIDTTGEREIDPGQYCEDLETTLSTLIYAADCFKQYIHRVDRLDNDLEFHAESYSLFGKPMLGGLGFIIAKNNPYRIPTLGPIVRVNVLQEATSLGQDEYIAVSKLLMSLLGDTAIGRPLALNELCDQLAACVEDGLIFESSDNHNLTDDEIRSYQYTMQPRRELEAAVTSICNYEFRVVAAGVAYMERSLV